jgi:hypothetical protein
MGNESLTIEVEIMKKTAIALTLGLGLAMTGFAQSAAKSKGRPSVRKSAAASPIVADAPDRAPTSKSNPPKAKAPGRASGPTVIKAKPQPSQLMMALDANEDGKLSLEEIKAAVKAFKTLDENEDGELTLNEFGPAPVIAKQSRASALDSGLKSITPTGPSQSGAKPSGRPGRRPTAKPSGRLGKKPTALANRTTPGTKKPSAKRPRPSAKRPSARPRPNSKPGTGVAQKNARGDGASAKSSETPTGRATPKRVARKSPARKKSKSASRRRPASKPTTTPAAAASPVDAELKALVGDTEAVTEQIKQAVAKIKNPAKKQAALRWVRRGSRELLSSLGKELEGQDADKKADQVEEAKQKLDEVRKLLE